MPPLHLVLRIVAVVHAVFFFLLALIGAFIAIVYFALHVCYVGLRLAKSYGSTPEHGVIDSVEVAYRKISTLTRQNHGGKYIKRPSGFRFSYHFECRGRRCVGSSVYIDDAVLFDEATSEPWIIAIGVVLGACAYIFLFGRYGKRKAWSAYGPADRDR